MAEHGWIKVHRKLARHPMWLRGPFTIGQAWVDLLMLANYEPSISRLGDLTVDRAQVLTSIELLGRRWGRDRKTVRRWLGTWGRDGMLTRQWARSGRRLHAHNYSHLRPLSVASCGRMGRRWGRRYSDR